uniref:Thioredoxin-like fold domain-containing protein n=1 Tax=Aplanochytrium stocchinoi TaxID=215587 RepID=A0A7S3PMV2_9STRA
MEPKHNSKKAKMANRKSWKMFFDLQCPYSKKCWLNLPGIRKRFEDEFDISVHLTSLAFHPQAFTAQCAANLIGGMIGKEARERFQDTCFEQQENYMNAALGDARKSDVDAVFASIAENAGVFSNKLTKKNISGKAS